MLSCRSAGPYMPDMPMQPRPRADTVGPLVPSGRCCILFLRDRRTPRRRPLPAPLSFDERQEIAVELILVGRWQTVGGARVDLQRGALDDLGRKQRRGTDRHDLVIVAVQNQGRYIDLLEI